MVPEHGEGVGPRRILAAMNVAIQMAAAQVWSGRSTALGAAALGLRAVATAPPPALARIGWPPPAASLPSWAPPQVRGGPTGTAGRLSEWIVAVDDNGARPFMIVDKLNAMVFAFDAAGRFLGAAPVLVGLARGDDSAPGLAGRRLSAIRPAQRTTPAGRFVAHFGGSLGHGTVLWVDYADAISMHPVMSVSPGEHRQQRIRSADPTQHRISYGCINVPAKFYEDVVRTAFARRGGVVYVLPDTKPLDRVFPRFVAAVSAPGDLRTATAVRANRVANYGAPDPRNARSASGRTRRATLHPPRRLLGPT